MASETGGCRGGVAPGRACQTIASKNDTEPAQLTGWLSPTTGISRPAIAWFTRTPLSNASLFPPLNPVKTRERDLLVQLHIRRVLRLCAVTFRWGGS